MSIGADIKQVFAEVGTYVHVENSEVREFVDYDFNVQVGNPFLREHLRIGSFSHDTQINAGDVLYVPKNGERLLVVNYIPEMFENEIVAINTTLYKCNVYFRCYREVREEEESNLRGQANRSMVWSLVGEGHAAFTASLRGNISEISEYQTFGDFLVRQDTLFYSNAIHMRPKDRVVISDTEYYEVGNVDERRFNQCSVCMLNEDTRHNNYEE